MKTKLHLSDALSRWTKRQLKPQSSWYIGQGVNPVDLNSQMLENIYNGIRTEISRDAARNFAEFVSNLKNLSAFAFLQAFETFWESEFRNVNIVQGQFEIYQPISRRRIIGAEVFVAYADGLFGGTKNDPTNVALASNNIKREFVDKHESEIRGFCPPEG